MTEAERRRRRFALIRRRFEADEAAQEAWRDIEAGRMARAPEAVALLDDLSRDLDLAAFRAGLDTWSSRPGYEGERGFTLMFVNQLTNRAADDPAPAARVIADALRVPADEAAAAAKIEALTAHVNSVKSGGHPAPGRVPHLVSLFWSMQDHARWPCLWPSAEEMLKALGWLTTAWEQPERYARFRDAVLMLDEPPVVVEQTLYWFQQVRWAGLDPALPERCAENAVLLRRFDEAGGYVSDTDRSAAERNARAIQGELALLARRLPMRLTEALGREVTAPDMQLKTSFKSDAPYRADGYAAWSVAGGMAAPSIRVWVTDRGVAVGAHPGWPQEGSQEEAGQAWSGRLPEGLEFFRVHPHSSGSRLEPAGAAYPGGECFAGRWHPH